MIILDKKFTSLRAERSNLLNEHSLDRLLRRKSAPRNDEGDI